MLGIMMKSPHFMKVFVFFLVLAVAGLIVGISTGAFEHNNRAALRQAREQPATAVKLLKE